MSEPAQPSASPPEPPVRGPADDLLGAVLAGGQSRRMGVDKALLAHPAGGSLLARAVATLQQVCRQVVIIGRPGTEAEGVRCLADRRPGQGPLAGLESALDAAAQQAPPLAAVQAIPCDMPGLTAELLVRLTAFWRQTPTRAAVVCFADQADRPPIAVVPTAYAPMVAKLLDEGRRSLHGFWEAIEPRELRVEPSAGRAANVNTPEEWAAWLAGQPGSARLLAVDLGLRTGLACYGRDGRLLRYRSQHYGAREALKRAIPGLLAEFAPLARVYIEGGGALTSVWHKAAAQAGIEGVQLAAEQWRTTLLLPRQQRSGRVAKETACALARLVIAEAGLPRPTALRHDAAEAILLGLWASLQLGWRVQPPAGFARAVGTDPG